MTDDPRDPLDDAIARDLGSLAPADIDADATLGFLRPALHRARSRHRLVVMSRAVAVVAVVAGAGALLSAQGPAKVDVQGPDNSTPVASSTTTTSRPTVSTTTNPAVTPTTTDDTTPTTVPPGPTTPTTTTTTTTLAPATTETYTSVGGTVTVTLANGRLTLDDYEASAGYQADVHTQKPDDVEVRFSNGDNESRIRVRIQDGRMRPEIDEG